MTATTPTPVWSGFCNVARHHACRGTYNGHPCPCDCHQEPEPGLRIGSLFSGYGGLEQGVQSVVGGTVAWHCEHEPPSKANPRPSQGAARILAHRYPGVPNHGDITAVDWSQVEPVEVLTLGFPCQDVSLAGLRKGLRPDSRSGLWTHAAHAINQLRPSLVVIENVRGLLSAEAHSDLEPCPWCVGDGSGVPLRALGAVLGDLADIGYDASWQGLRAADVGAPHGRYRIFVAARPAADADHGADHGQRPRAVPGGRGAFPPPHSADDGRERGWPSRHGRDGSADHGHAADPDATGLGRRPSGRDDGLRSEGLVSVDWGQYAHAVRRWERVTGAAAPSPTELSAKGSPRLSPAFVEWMMGLPAGWVTDVPGLSRNEQLKALGNGVVPQQAAQALRMLLPDANALVAAA